MEFHRHSNDEQNVITAYGDEGLRIGQVVVTESCIVSPAELIDRWPVTEVSSLTSEHFAPVRALQPEVVILGTGAHLQFPPQAPGQSLTEHGIGFEFMDTAAACRTYNVLVHEGRNVVAALIIGAGP